MAQPPKEIAREIARDEVNDALREVFRHDRDHPDASKPSPADVLDHGRRQMARGAFVRAWWGKIVLLVAGIIVSTAGGDAVKWLLKKLFP